jgi:hypothetical protein
MRRGTSKSGRPGLVCEQSVAAATASEFRTASGRADDDEAAAGPAVQPVEILVHTPVSRSTDWLILPSRLGVDAVMHSDACRRPKP